MPRVAFLTLGCKVNQGESAGMTQLFKEAAYEVVPFTQPADVYVVNTCAVTMQAERKSRQAVRRAREQNPAALVAMVGCYPQVAQDKLQEMHEVDLLIGTSEKGRIVELVERTRIAGDPLIAVSEWTDETAWQLESNSEDIGRTRATLKVQDGCQQFCSYCIIPYARGPERSRPVEAILAETARLVAQGYKEIVLTGIHLGAYGRDLDPQQTLKDLLGSLLQVPGLSRLRLSSVEPNDITEDLLRLIAESPALCRHLHIPLQSGSDTVLERMSRRYSTNEYRQIVQLARYYVPQIAITSDVIVGFPGETESEFAETLAFVSEMAFSRLHVFRYSRRPGTPAADMEQQIREAVKGERSQALIRQAEQLSLEYRTSLLGQSVDVLWEHAEKGVWSGHTDTYVKVYMRDETLQSSQISSVVPQRLYADGVWSEL